VRKKGFVALAVIAVGAVVAGATVAAAGSRTAAKPCSFNLRIGDVLPFTGGLAA